MMLCAGWQAEYEQDGVLRFVLVDHVSRYGYDLHLQLEARSALGLWSQVQVYSLHAREFALVPCATSRPGMALCLSCMVDGVSGLVNVEDVITIAMDGSSVHKHRRYCAGNRVLAETHRVLSYTEDELHEDASRQWRRATTVGGSSASSTPPDYTGSGYPLANSVQLEPRHTRRGALQEVCVVSSHELDGHIHYHFRVRWTDSEDEDEPRSVTVSKRQSEMVALDKALRAHSDESIIAIADQDRLLPRLTGLLKAQASVSAGAKRSSADTLVAWLEQALRHPLA
eukprot:COSAG01_NODE_16559_length_1226_cov_1.314996_1_plen_283_part_01